MSAFTPGPWEVGDAAQGEDPRMVYCDDATGQRIAKCSGKFLFHSRETMEANARLIAAAPDMLVALRSVACVLTDLGRVNQNGLTHNLVLKALAKAEGRS